MLMNFELIFLTILAEEQVLAIWLPSLGGSSIPGSCRTVICEFWWHFWGDSFGFLMN
jgi:hypothetical protein